jgi:hypothetical protein
MSSFKTILQITFGKHVPTEYEELNLDDFWKNKHSLTKDEKVALEEYKNLIILSLNNIGLSSLENFPAIKNLYYLSLKNNELNGDDFDLIPKLFPNLKKLKISGNNIEKINNLYKLRNLKLRKIEVKENPFSVGNKKYKNKLMDLLPTLEIIDQEDNVGERVETTDYHNEEKELEDDEDYKDEKEEEEEYDEELDEEEDEDDK